MGELEVIEHIQSGRPLVDTRLEHFFRDGTIPGARSVPHEDILSHRDTLDPTVQTVFFCNGPQCAATPQMRSGDCSTTGIPQLQSCTTAAGFTTG